MHNDFENTQVYQDWEGTLPQIFKESPVWQRLHVYRQACFLLELTWRDTRDLRRDSDLRPVVGQLYRAVGSIGANLTEGFGRNSAKDRVRLWEYAMTSAQEAQHWYVSLQHVLKGNVLNHRLGMLASIIRQITALIPHQRNLREDSELYNTESFVQNEEDNT